MERADYGEACKGEKVKATKKREPKKQTIAMVSIRVHLDLNALAYTVRRGTSLHLLSQASLAALPLELGIDGAMLKKHRNHDPLGVSSGVDD